MPRSRKQDEIELLSTEGQILLCLEDGPKSSHEIYDLVNASNPTVLRRISWLMSISAIEARPSVHDKRVIIYSLNEGFPGLLDRLKRIRAADGTTAAA